MLQPAAVMHSAKQDPFTGCGPARHQGIACCTSPAQHGHRQTVRVVWSCCDFKLYARGCRVLRATSFAAQAVHLVWVLCVIRLEYCGPVWQQGRVAVSLPYSLGTVAAVGYVGSHWAGVQRCRSLRCLCVLNGVHAEQDGLHKGNTMRCQALARPKEASAKQEWCGCVGDNTRAACRSMCFTAWSLVACRAVALAC